MINPQKNLLLFFSFLISSLMIISCSDKKDPFIGTWENVSYYGTLTLKIKKDGKEYFIYHNHEPLQHEEHNHGHEHSENKKTEPFSALLKKGSLHFTNKGKAQEIKLSENKKVLTVFDRQYLKISHQE